MSIAKVKTSNALEGRNSEDGNDSLNTVVRQAIGKEPFISFPRSTDNPVQWMQLLHGLDPDSSGWPLLPVKVPMQKCDKCNREFVSPINYRRHIRVHHRLKKLDKDTLKNRDLLHIFWDKLSAAEAKEIVALKNSTLEDLPGATVIKALASLIRKPGIPPLPHFCIKAGSALLDIVQARPSRFPLTSQEFFSILDDASEKTFLSGSAISIQKYIFDGEAAKIGLDTKNVVAFTSFVLEQKLVEARIADKDVEALRCQKLLVEEEEAAQKRQAEILERKRQKKLRQKEQKAKEHRNEEEVGIGDCFEIVEAFDHFSPEIPQIPFPEEADCEAQAGIGCADKDSNSCPTQHVPQKTYVVSRSNSTFKPEYKHRSGMRDLRVAHTVNNKKVWSRKSKPEKDGESLKIRMQEVLIQAGQDMEKEVPIGSIAVMLGSSQSREEHDSAECHKSTNRNATHSGGRNHSTVKFWRRRHDEVTDAAKPVDSGNGGTEVDSLVPENTESCIEEPYCTDYHNSSINDKSLPREAEGLGSLQFSSEAARAFLSGRWKEAIASDHVKLVLSPESGPSLNGSNQAELKLKSEKGFKKRYIPKQRVGT